MRALIAGDPALAAMAGDALDAPRVTPPDTPPDTPLRYRGRAPAAPPGLALLPAFEGRAAPATEDVWRAIRSAAPHLHWRTGYDADEVGQDFLDRSCWFDLTGPDGPFVTPGIRVMAGLWDRGLFYPRHWHRAEEIYCVIAGSARFISDGMEDGLLGPGDTRHHPPGLPHAAFMEEAPLLALGIWRGAGLREKPVLDPDWLARRRAGA